jgi:hypothetical protein
MSRNLEYIQKLAEANGGKCFSTEYNGMKEYYIFECDKGHTWTSTAHNIGSGRWCPECRKYIYSISDMRKTAKEKGGKCLSNTYAGCRSLLIWECEYGHTWPSKFETIKNGCWCPICAGNKKYTIVEINKIAEPMGVKCISTIYINAETPLNWECTNNHKWSSSYKSIRDNQKWCPHCDNSFIAEQVCRQYMEQIFGYKFPKCKPKFLINPNTNTRLELDGYCFELGLAFEHHGLQHYQKSHRFYSEEAISRDKIKLEICNLNNIKIIYIPALFAKTKLSDLKKCIKNECDRLNIVLPINYDMIDVVLNLYYNKNIEYFNRYVDIVQHRGGEILSTAYINSREKLSIKCYRGHIFEIRPDILKDGHWCAKCGYIERRENKCQQYQIK